MKFSEEKSKNKDFVEEFLEYHSNGKPKIKGKLLNKVKNGQWEEYYENGNLKRSVTYSKGLKDGRTFVFKENGEIDFFMDYKNGKLLISPKFKKLVGKKNNRI